MIIIKIIIMIIIIMIEMIFNLYFTRVTPSNTVVDFRCGPIPQVVQLSKNSILPRLAIHYLTISMSI